MEDLCEIGVWDTYENFCKFGELIGNFAIFQTFLISTYDFQVGDLVALVSGDSDPFWLAEISAIGEENLDLIYWHHAP
jgi:hypothetical protein